MSHDQGGHCHCSSEHRPAPLELNWHHIRPKEFGGEDTPDGVPDRNGVWICPTTHANVHELLRLIRKRQGALTWADVTAMYDVPVNRYTWLLAWEGYRRIVDDTWGRRVISL